MTGTSMADGSTCPCQSTIASTKMAMAINKWNKAAPTDTHASASSGNTTFLTKLALPTTRLGASET